MCIPYINFAGSIIFTPISIARSLFSPFMFSRILLAYRLVSSKSEMDVENNTTDISPASKRICKDITNKPSILGLPDKPVLRFTKLHPDASKPYRGSALSAGLDLKSCVDCVVKAKSRLPVRTGLSIRVPDGCYGRVAPRSGLAVKNFIDVGAGVIDQDYTGEVMVLLFNFGDEDFHVEKGARIAQLICERITIPELLECKDLEETERGSGGFGSTGMK